MMLQLLCWMLKGIFYEIMEKNGYQIKCLDVISSDFGKSHMYNPFVYVKTEVDMIRLVSNIQTSLTPLDR